MNFELFEDLLEIPLVLVVAVDGLDENLTPGLIVSVANFVPVLTDGWVSAEHFRVFGVLE